jgi:isopentenyl phosphate kinase
VPSFFSELTGLGKRLNRRGPPRGHGCDTLSSETRVACNSRAVEKVMTSRPFLILKIGGSLFSEKKLHRHIDKGALGKFARLVAELAQSAPGQVALIVGGGSFGHGAVRHVDPADHLGLLQLTEANFAQKWIWTEALRAEKVFPLPLQLTAMCMLDGGRLVLDGNVFRRALDLGILPILSGDCIIASDGSLRVFGSDRVPEVLLQILARPVRVAVLTDTCGIMSHSESRHVLRDVDADAPQEAYDSLWNAAEHDTTGGMSGKLQAMIEIARQGAECFVMKGDAEAVSLKFLFERPEDWPSEMLYTRIRRR